MRFLHIIFKFFFLGEGSTTECKIGTIFYLFIIICNKIYFFIIFLVMIFLTINYYLFTFIAISLIRTNHKNLIKRINHEFNSEYINDAKNG